MLSVRERTHYTLCNVKADQHLLVYTLANWIIAYIIVKYSRISITQISRGIKINSVSVFSESRYLKQYLKTLQGTHKKKFDTSRFSSRSKYAFERFIILSDIRPV